MGLKNGVHRVLCVDVIAKWDEGVGADDAAAGGGGDADAGGDRVADAVEVFHAGNRRAGEHVRSANSGAVCALVATEPGFVGGGGGDELEEDAGANVGNDFFQGDV